MKKKFALSLVIASMSTCVLANEDLDLEIRTLSVLHGISTAEAKKSLFLEANSDATLDAIEKEFKGRISGIYVENAPTYKIVVRVKGSGTNQKRNVAVGNAVSKQNLPIEIQYGATETKEAGRAQINNVSKLVKTYFNTVQSYAYDERTGAIVVSVKGKETSENLKKVDAIKMAWNNLNLPLEFKFVNWTIKPLVDAHGGSFVVDKSQAPTYFDCTTAFGIKDSTGKKYMSTAAHCPNNFEDKQNGTKYTFVGEIPFNQENDFQWNSTTATITNKFYVGPSTTRTLTGRRTLAATKVGHSVCHYGVATGYSCGTVAEVATSVGDSNFPGNFWVKVNTNTCGGSDSGGPVFTASTIASGILSLGAMDDQTGACQGYYYVPTDKIYENGFSFVY
ncbi:hypothetical protein [Acinetobacter gyllenbergii]|uniref:hypothetical protein n=1 Tax=Acinetobacter gyllenbergii TaxID=134534 RepID=UPI003F5472C6